MRVVVDIARSLALALAVGWLGTASAQNDDVPRAPRLDAPSSSTAESIPLLNLSALRPPNGATLAPLPEERHEEQIEELIVTGQGWRLPDLGSEWRARQAEAERSGRFHATALPLYDPERPPLRMDPLLATPEARRHGYIELFRIEFGGDRDRDRDE